ncbi:MAG: acyl-CoA thioesterase II [Xanthomonadales bacterium]|nr:acyl-CoA thioesterase II [Xanthomonadales bacterium]
MNQQIADDLVHLLRLERLEVNLFRGESRDIGSAQVFGGQVLGQALSAATYTVDDRRVHSLHAYFLRRGDVAAPIVYEVDRQRDGRSISNRRVVAVQHGRPIFNMAASFQVPQSGLEHQFPMPDVTPPEDLPSETFESVGMRHLPEKVKRFLFERRPFEFKWERQLDRSGDQAFRRLWFRPVGRVPAEQPLHDAMLAYVSDYGLLTTALLPHGQSLFSEDLQMASIDHAMWFHGPFDINQWLLYDLDSPVSRDTRGLCRGLIYTCDGELVASTAQEGLIRMRTEG